MTSVVTIKDPHQSPELTVTKRNERSNSEGQHTQDMEDHINSKEEMDESMAVLQQKLQEEHTNIETGQLINADLESN